MQKLILVFLLSLCSFARTAKAQEQFTVTGQVIDSATQQPLTGASVFCQNTTFGVITNAEGRFIIKLPKGGYDLVVTYTGYQSSGQRISTASSEPLLIALKAKDKSMEAVTVAGSNEVPDGWAKYGSFFQEQFFGSTANAAQCTLLNPEALRFFYSKKRNRLKVLAKEELQVVNNALGYKIRYQLDSLSFEYGTSISTVSGFPFFEKMTGTPEQETQWQKNRDIAYRGSKLHFMRSWYEGDLENEGFEIERVNTAAKNFEATRIANPYDSNFYQVDSAMVDIDLKGRFRIKYKNELPDPKFVKEFKLPSQIRVQLSILDILDAFTIEENGYWFEQADLINTGYWSYERMAEAVPYDYEPGD
ncbi:carboxypeptidase-like regulatory domain-containing protein [Flavihumibacter rivuli]|uniref:carboxypeptidase-like regulatory domain-containing protein n=1 Tax=Flavihumibacter rivuli TaxID=2838156 RepID=UPI001BDE8A44|nr:carboxypeptidase-like regulatory domain-containing protein [Flavihumibacter rivuli]ULQ56123.1 carboxypeptidase-like regulatory domain-containing protein [Flavihumibacter rivuli]